MSQKNNPMQKFKSQHHLTRLAKLVVSTAVLLLFGAECLSIQTASSQYAEDLSAAFSSKLGKQKIKVQTVVTFSPDGQTLASASDNGVVKLWNLNGKQIATLTGHRNGVNSISFSPDGNRIVTAGNDKTVKLWDRYGSELRSIKTNTNLVVLSACETGQIITYTSDSKSIKIGKINDDASYTITWSEAFLTGIKSTSANCQNIATVNHFGTVNILNVGSRIQQTFNVDGSQIESVNFSPNGQIISVLSHNNIKFITLNGRELKNLKSDKKINGTQLSPNGELFAVTYEDGTVEVRNFDDKKLRYILSANSNANHSIAFSKDSKNISLGAKDGTVKIFNSNNGKLLHILNRGNRNKIESVNYHFTSDFLSCRYNNGLTKIWNLKNPLTYIEHSLPNTIVILALGLGFGIIFFIRIKHLQNTQNQNTAKSQSSYIITGWVVYVLPEDWRGNLEALRCELISANKPDLHIKIITVITLLDMVFGGIRVKLHNFYDGNNFMAAIGRRSITNGKDRLANHKDLNE
jgi:WD40 repeat protein